MMLIRFPHICCRCGLYKSGEPLNYVRLFKINVKLYPARIYYLLVLLYILPSATLSNTSRWAVIAEIPAVAPVPRAAPVASPASARTAESNSFVRISLHTRNPIKVMMLNEGHGNQLEYCQSVIVDIVLDTT
ncbi:hypothetical protein BDV33DRAFT_163689 [Aspergillus novoparasiticus]|uniref:Uncharacterized protein n=1 Tax=Aspergillus novoparasiticus TaxID=986946 RepID=A0A5N6F7G5_9EURO|nr:hypothetical protein BDV33DRAFT_163689 [Aspergillus novoparasiticus]